MKLTNYKGENVSRAVSLIIGAHKRMVIVNKVPDEFPKQLLGIFETSSVKD